MNIVHIANFYGPKSGGIRTTLHHLGKEYNKSGHSFTYIVPGGSLFSEVTPFGLKITVPSLPLPFSGGYRIIKSNKQIKKYLTLLKPDRIEISDRFTLLSIGKWAKNRKIPSLVFSHETLEGLSAALIPRLPFRSQLVNWHNTRLASSFDNVVATTDFAATEFIKLDTKNLAKIALGVDLENFHPVKRSAEIHNKYAKNSKYLIVHCGRLSPEKNPELSLAALKELVLRDIDVRLVFIGMGPQWKKLKTLAEGYPVDFLGFIANPEMVAEILASADVTLAPGPIETFCLAALESISAGTPVVASNTSAVGEVLNANGAEPAGFVARNNAIDFADAILKVLSHEEMRSFARSQAEKFSWESTVKKILELQSGSNLEVFEVIERSIA